MHAESVATVVPSRDRNVKRSQGFSCEPVYRIPTSDIDGGDASMHVFGANSAGHTWARTAAH